ncbi:hypothetical protein [Actinomadura sp. NPDC000600]|uniref:hypothetical protein n=1 Tax=Actinomadura sp. NPDC000600 TaxID=3154262 RepID=UPI0033927E50
MLPLGLALTPVLTAALALAPFEPSPTPTTSEPTPPAPAATVSVVPASVPVGGAPVTVAAVCADGTAKAVVKSDAFAGGGAFNGARKLTLKTSAEARAGKYAVNLLCDGTAVSASTSLLITQATTPSPTPTSPTPTSPAPNPTPSGPPQTGGGSTSVSGPFLLGGVLLIGTGAAAGTFALRRRRQGGA